MRSILLLIAVFIGGVSAHEAKQAEYYDFGSGATVMLIAKHPNGQVKLEGGKPLSYKVHVRWITKAMFQSAPVAAGGDGVLEEIYIYQLDNGEVWHTVAAHWKDPVFAPPVEADPSKDVSAPKLISGSRCGDILKVDGDLLPTPPKMRVEVFCRCNGEIKSRRWVQVMMDGKEHFWPDDK